MSLTSPTIMTASSIVILLLILFFILNNKRKQSTEYRLHEMLAPYTKDELIDVVIPDGVGGLLEIEHIVLLEQGILIIETYPMEGNLFGAENIEQWSQIIGGRSYKFSNPLHHIHIARQAVRNLAPKTPVFCRVIFNANSSFPKGMPKEVSILDSLANDLLQINNEKSVAIDVVWQKIKTTAINNQHEDITNHG